MPIPMRRHQSERSDTENESLHHERSETLSNSHKESGFASDSAEQELSDTFSDGGKSGGRASERFSEHPDGTVVK